MGGALLPDEVERFLVKHAREVDIVAEGYRERLVAVSRFIHDRQGAASIRGFADAFRFRKD